MEIPAEIRDAMVQHALEEDPNECCGILAGAGGIVLQHYRITNTEKSPYRYSMDGLEVHHVEMEVEENGWEFLAFYHSHTHSPAYPSNTDVRLAANWPDPYYLIISLMTKGDDKQPPHRWWRRLFGFLFADKPMESDRQPPVIRLFTITDGTVTEEPVVIV